MTSDDDDPLKIADPMQRLAALEKAERRRRKAAAKAERQERAEAEFRAAWKGLFEFA